MEKADTRQKKIPEDLWIKCEQCGEVIYQKDFMSELKVCLKCDLHYPLNAQERIETLLDKDSFEEMDKNLYSTDPLEFGEAYKVKLLKDRKQTGLNEAIVTGKGLLSDHRVVFCVMDFRFRGASMGSVVGEKVARAVEVSLKERLPLIIVSSSGGARMQEGMFSLMQMAKTSAALGKLSKTNIPYISIMANPTTAGVAASFASLGDVIIAEPKALIGFAGPRVIEQTIRQKLPAGFQRAEFYLEHGMVDMVVHRKELRDTVNKLLDFLSPVE
jgi:acetyl-CoA carboxylase carboxyl transferase subunit beta